LITRTELSDLAPAIEKSVRLWNADAPIFRARLEAEAWVEHSTGHAYAIAQRPFERAGAFCGLGNPQSFRRTLERLGVEPVQWTEFEDHHRYSPHELRRIAAHAKSFGATALVTTEKDAINLCEGSGHLLAPLPLYWLKVGMRIDGEDEFLNEIVRRTG
jgi:tetraacyldisaccharide 4'-kinase